MSFGKLTVITGAIIFSSAANAALVERLGGMAYYDTEADLTWLADAGYAQTSGYDVDGHMTWNEAMEWVSGLNINGVTGWRLPDTALIDTTCDGSADRGISWGYNCSQSEMANMYYNVFGGVAAPSPERVFNANADLFTNIGFQYWSGTGADPFLSGTEYDAYLFNFGLGFQTVIDKNTGYINDDLSVNAWAVYDGDVGAVGTVPLPAAMWLFGSGLIGLAALARYRRTSKL